tara:strand:+ start:1010 stop:1558 length:549 start_codon:yes stop_codon:yes gene_type:complete
MGPGAFYSGRWNTDARPFAEFLGPGSYIATDGQAYPIRYVKSVDAIALGHERGSTQELEASLSEAMEAIDVAVLLAVLGVDDIAASFDRIFSTYAEIYTIAGVGTEGVLTHFMLSEGIRMEALDFYAELPLEISEAVVDRILSLPYEDFPKHRVGYSPDTKRELMRGFAERGSLKAHTFLDN